MTSTVPAAVVSDFASGYESSASSRDGIWIRFQMVGVWVAVVALTLAIQEVAAAFQDENASVVVESAVSPSGLERDTLTGDWGGGRSWLEERGITLKPRLTQFCQGMTTGEGDHGADYGGKVDLLFDADLRKLGFWDGLSMVVHAEYNYGQSANGRGDTLMQVNTALEFPGMEGSDAFDLSSVYFRQNFGDSASLMIGKINSIDAAADKPFAGGAGIDSFQNIVFAAPPSGTVPPYLLGAMFSVRTEPATFGLWVYDPNSAVNSTGLEDPFADGVTLRGTVTFPVAIAGRSGHQGIVAVYSSKNGIDLESLGEVNLPATGPGTIGLKNERYYFAYVFDQYLYQDAANSKEGFGLFGQFGISDGNPNKLHWGSFMGVGGTGLIPGRSRDNWGVGYYYYSVSNYLIEAFPNLARRGEQGFEMFYNFAVTPWFSAQADLQVLEPDPGTTAVFPGIRAVIRF